MFWKDVIHSKIFAVKNNTDKS